MFRISKTSVKSLVVSAEESGANKIAALWLTKMKSMCASNNFFLESLISKEIRLQNLKELEYGPGYFAKREPEPEVANVLGEYEGPEM